MAGTMSRTLFLDQAMDLILGLRPDFSAQDVRRLQTMLKDQLLPFQGEHIGVLTPNIIAGLIANRLNLMGPSSIGRSHFSTPVTNAQLVCPLLLEKTNNSYRLLRHHNSHTYNSHT